jgi:hypothetical protein
MPVDTVKRHGIRNAMGRHMEISCHSVAFMVRLNLGDDSALTVGEPGMRPDSVPMICR